MIVSSYAAHEIAPQTNVKERKYIMNALLQCENICKSFSGRPVLIGTNLTLERGRIIGLLGPNGSGKSTLIKLINGLLKPDNGSIRVNGLEIGPETKKIISYLPERTYLADGMRVKEILTFFEDFYEDFDAARAREMLERLKIEENARMKTLSKGTKEKVQLILVMSRRAQLYILDEPIGGVDPAAREYILDTILHNYGEDSSILISTHLISEIERVLDDVVFMTYGGVTAPVSAETLRQENGMSVDAYFRQIYRM